MTEAITAQQMRDIERAAIDSGAVTGLELMERAGQGVVEAVMQEWPDKRPGTYSWVQESQRKFRPMRAVILCGPGNNGGDGYVVARLLAEKGWDVSVYATTIHHLPPDAAHNLAAWQAIGAVNSPKSERADRDWAEAFGCEFADIVVDALFGIGLKRPLSGPLGYIAGRVAEKKQGRYANNVVAIDLPSGLDGDSGKVLGGSIEQLDDYRATGRSFAGFAAVPADLTVTFHCEKRGHVLNDGPLICGKVVVKDIGL